MGVGAVSLLVLGALGYVLSRLTDRNVVPSLFLRGVFESFGIDARGNTTTVTDPEGTRTASPADDYTTTYEYGAPGTSLAPISEIGSFFAARAISMSLFTSAAIGAGAVASRR